MTIRSCALAIAAILGCAAPVTLATVEHRVSGFATFGLALNDSPTLVFRRDLTQDDGALKDSGSWKSDSLLGLQWQGRWSRWDATVQLVAKDRFENSLGDSVEWAFIGYRPVEGFGLRVGRLGADVFMLSEYRQVGYAFPWVRPPHDLYGMASLYRFDGMDLTKRINVGDAMLDIKGFAGNSGERYPTGFNSGESTAFDFDLYGASAKLEWNDWKLRYTLVRIEVNSDGSRPLRDALQASLPLWPQAAQWAPLLETREKQFNYRQLGLSYDNNDWWFHSEFLSLDSDVTLVASGNHAYASLGKRFNSISLYLLAGYADPRNSPFDVQAPFGLPEVYAVQLAQLAAVTERTLNGVRIKQHSVGLGARWDFAAKMALKLQAEQFDVDSQGTNLWFRTDPTTPVANDQRPRIISLALDVLF